MKRASKRKSFIHFSSDRGNNSTIFLLLFLLLFLPSLAARMRSYSTPPDETNIETQKKKKRAFHFSAAAVSPPRTGGVACSCSGGQGGEPTSFIRQRCRFAHALSTDLPSEAGHRNRSEAAMKVIVIPLRHSTLHACTIVPRPVTV